MKESVEKSDSEIFSFLLSKEGEFEPLEKELFNLIKQRRGIQNVHDAKFRPKEDCPN